MMELQSTTHSSRERERGRRGRTEKREVTTEQNGTVETTVTTWRQTETETTTVTATTTECMNRPGERNEEWNTTTYRASI
jgi:hypothetical protein